MERRPYRRILLKVSGEVLMGDASFGIGDGDPRCLWPRISPPWSRRVSNCAW